MQDATLRDKGQYRFYLYDKLERTVVQGLCNGYNRSEEMNIAEFKENIGGLCNTGYNIPLSDKITNPNLETVNYYDNYTFLPEVIRWYRKNEKNLPVKLTQLYNIRCS